MVNKKSPAANTEMLYLVTLQDYQRGRFKNRLIVYVCVCVCVCVQIVVEGLVGSGVQGDLAIDDIAIRNGSCPHAG